MASSLDAFSKLLIENKQLKSDKQTLLNQLKKAEEGNTRSEQLEREKQQDNYSISALLEKIKQLNCELAEYQKDKQNYERNLSTLEEKIRNQAAHLHEVQKISIINKALTMKVVGLEGELARKESDHQTRLEENRAMRAERDNKIAQLHKEKGELDKRREKAETSKFRIIRERDAYQEEVRRANERAKTIEREYQEVIARLRQEQEARESQLKGFNDAQKQQIDELKMELEQCANKRDMSIRARNRILILEREVEEKERMIQDLHRFLSKLRNDAIESQMMIRDLQANYDIGQEGLRIEKEKTQAMEQYWADRMRSAQNDLTDRCCLICNDEMDGSEREFESLPKCRCCKRRYHKECLSRWLIEKEECPVCKTPSSTMINVPRY